MEHVDILGPNCTAQPMYVLKPTWSYYRKWCGSDDDGARCDLNVARPRLVSTMQFWWTSRLAMQLFFFRNRP